MKYSRAPIEKLTAIQFTPESAVRTIAETMKPTLIPKMITRDMLGDAVGFVEADLFSGAACDPDDPADGGWRWRRYYDFCGYLPYDRPHPLGVAFCLDNGRRRRELSAFMHCYMVSAFPHRDRIAWVNAESIGVRSDSAGWWIVYARGNYGTDPGSSIIIAAWDGLPTVWWQFSCLDEGKRVWSRMYGFRDQQTRRMAESVFANECPATVYVECELERLRFPEVSEDRALAERVGFPLSGW